MNQGQAELNWRRATRCSHSACVEMAEWGTEVFVRDSKEIDGPVLAFGREQWIAFVAAAGSGEFVV